MRRGSAAGRQHRDNILAVGTNPAKKKTSGNEPGRQPEFTWGRGPKKVLFAKRTWIFLIFRTFHPALPGNAGSQWLATRQAMIKTWILITLRSSVNRGDRASCQDWDENQTFPIEVIKKLGKLGYLGAIFPEEYRARAWLR